VVDHAADPLTILLQFTFFLGVVLANVKVVFALIDRICQSRSTTWLREWEGDLGFSCILFS